MSSATKTFFFAYLLLAPLVASHVLLSWGQIAGFEAPDGRMVKLYEWFLGDDSAPDLVEIYVADRQGDVLAVVPDPPRWRGEANYACLAAEMCIVFLWETRPRQAVAYRLNLASEPETCANVVACNFQKLHDPHWAWLARLSRVLAQSSRGVMIVGGLGIVLLLFVKAIQGCSALIPRVASRGLLWSLIVLRKTLLLLGILVVTIGLPFAFMAILPDSIRWITWPPFVALTTAVCVSYLFVKWRSKKQSR